MAHVLANTEVGDITAVSSLLQTVEGQIAGVIAAGAHDGSSVYGAAFLRHYDALPDIRIWARASSIVSTNNAGTPTARNHHVQLIVDKSRTAWQKATGYGRHGRLETAIGRYKYSISPELPARSGHA